MISLRSRLIACCKLAPTLARQMWRHNYVIGRNEYLIFTFSESVNPWVYSLQFLFKFTNNSWRYERKCEWVFFSEHSVCGADLDVLGSRHIIRHMANSHLISQVRFLPKLHCEREYPVVEIMASNILGSWLDFHGHVTSSVTWPFGSP